MTIKLNRLGRPPSLNNNNNCYFKMFNRSKPFSGKKLLVDTYRSTKN